ncbi:MAG: TadE/TadG family type IV pilus assembly protein [Hyphomicrobiaceae bacterium]
MITQWWSNSKFARADGGNVAMIGALALLPVTVLAGGTVDYGRAMSERTRLQAAAEAGAFGGTRQVEATDATRIAAATALFQSNLNGSGLRGVTPVVTVSGKQVTVSATTTVGTPFLGLVSVPSLTMSVSATVEATDVTTTTTVAGGKVCLLALDPNSDNGIHIQGDNQVKLGDCWAHTNSSKASAINSSGSQARAESNKGFCAVGSASLSDESTFSPKPKTGCKTMNDPFAKVGAYSGGTYEATFSPPYKAITCKASNLSLKKGEFTLDPGRYCGGINIQAGATVTFNPGIYYIDNGELNVQSGSTALGTNVLFYLEGAGSKFQIIGGGSTQLSGRHDTASYRGFLIIQHPNANTDGESNIQGGGSFKLQGMVYAPRQRIEVSGNGDVNNLDLSVFGMVAKDFYFRGNGMFNLKRHTGEGKVPDLMPELPLEQINQTVLK